ncbi:MAG: ribbon-helix-helix domain-containing protein [Ancrocorticia sp.]|uniref:ribbon-helix-helix domain-containing protein n=1 Tax=Ancrocorticia sp. TaxID=2593684 RepID=UPI003F8DA882
MRTTKQLSITLPNNMADALKERVASGAYASESEVVRDGLRALFSQEEAVERWLRTEVLASVEATRADPSRAINSEDMRTYLSGLRAKYDVENDL